jgi:N-acetylmuramoyl-L-alanine amidase
MRFPQRQHPIARLGILLCSAIILAVTFTPFLQEVWATSSTDRNRDRPRATTYTKKPHVKGTTASLTPATIQDVRVLTSPEKTRLVLDLDRQTPVIEQQAQDPRRVVFTLNNVSLSRVARVKATDGTVPAPLLVAETKAHAVALTLPMAPFRTYKQFTLSNPPRLVVDVTPPIERRAPPAPPISEAPNQLPGQLPFPVQPTAPPAKGYKTIVIDPGHGGRDSGARGQHQTEEKDITLRVALRLRELLSKQPATRVLMTRDRDVFVELEERAKFANSNEADLFVSIHVNSHPSRSIRGLEVYHFGEAKDQRALEVAARENGTPLNSTGVGWEYLVADLLTTKKIEASLELAWTAKEAMVARMNGPYAIHDHGVKTAPFYVLRFTSMPSILAEIAYISNPDEEDLLRRPTFIKDVAQSLFQGINSFLANDKSDVR